MLHFKTVNILIIQKLTIALTWMLAWLLVFFGRVNIIL